MRKQRISLNRFGLALTLSVLLGGWACKQQTPIQVAQTARDSIASASAFVASAEKQHTECALEATGKMTKICSLIHDGKVSVNLSVDALHEYCASTSYDTGGVCTPNPSLQTHLTSALNNVNQIITDIKAVK